MPNLRIVDVERPRSLEQFRRHWQKTAGRKGLDLNSSDRAAGIARDFVDFSPFSPHFLAEKRACPLMSGDSRQKERDLRKSDSLPHTAVQVLYLKTDQ